MDICTRVNFQDWDNHLNATATGFYHNNSAAVGQRGGTLIVYGCEFATSGEQLSLGAAASKTVVSGNIVAGKLNVVTEKGYSGKQSVTGNLDDT